MYNRDVSEIALPRQWPYTAQEFMERTHCAPHYLDDVLAGLLLAGWIEAWGLTSDGVPLYGPSEWVQKATAAATVNQKMSE